MRLEIFAAATALALMSSVALAQNTPSTEGAHAYIVNLENGEHVSSPVLVQFGLTGMGISPAGVTGQGTENTGHHHLVIDSPTPQAGVPIPAEAGKYVHFGRGQTETTLELAPGEHTLQLVLGDAAHIPHSPPVMSERITIVVDP
jgi:hypothetical protein